MLYRTPKHTYTEIAEVLNYIPETGELIWLRSSGNAKAGARAGCYSQNLKYRLVGVLGEYYYEHRVAWLLHYGEWPRGYVDHINRDKLDNRITNLRVCTKQQNIANAGPKKHNKLGVKGVYRRKDKFRACIRVHGRTKNLGTFDTVQEAAAAYATAARDTFGEFAQF